MKVIEKITQKVLMELDTVECNGYIGNFCAVHSEERGTHVWFTECVVEREEVVERPATVVDILDFWKMYVAGASTMLIQAKYPEFGIRFSKLILQWLTEATDTKADPTLINEPLKASSSSGCPCNRPVLECNC